MSELRERPRATEPAADRSDDAAGARADASGDGAPPRRFSRRALLLGGAAGAVLGAAAVAGLDRARSVPQPSGGTAAAAGPDLGLLAVEDFRTRGASDDEVLERALRHAAAQSRKPAVVFANRTYDLTRPVRPYPGLHLRSFPFGDEFDNGQLITLPAGGLISFDRDANALTLENLSCRLRDRLLPAILGDASTGAWTDVRVIGGGYTGPGPLLEGSFLRLDFQPRYVNGLTDSALRIGGSDSWLFTSGAHFVGGTLPPDVPFLDLAYLGQSTVGGAYITAQGGYGVDISGSAPGLQLEGTKVDATNRRGSTATQLAGVQIRGGVDTTIDDLWVFNADASGRSGALVSVTGGTGLVLNRPRFPGSNAGSVDAHPTTACIHTTVPITVVAPAATGRAALITQSDPGLVTLVGAPGWTVATA